jgi:hypothetical protein
LAIQGDHRQYYDDSDGGPMISRGSVVHIVSCPRDAQWTQRLWARDHVLMARLLDPSPLDWLLQKRFVQSEPALAREIQGAGR